MQNLLKINKKQLIFQETEKKVMIQDWGHYKIDTI